MLNVLTLSSKMYCIINNIYWLFFILNQTEFGTVMFEDVAVTCYNMLDHYSLYKQYLESMKLLYVPVHTTATPPTAPPSLLEIPSTQSALGMAPPGTNYYLCT